MFDRLSIVAPVRPEDEAMLADQCRVVEAPVLEYIVNSCIEKLMLFIVKPTNNLSRVHVPCTLDHLWAVQPRL